MDEITLIQLMKGQFSAARFLSFLGAIFFIFAVFLGLFSIFSEDESIILVTPFMMAFLNLLTFVAHRLSRSERSRGEILRYLLMLQDGLDWQISPYEQANAEAEASLIATMFAKRSNSVPYYASPKDKGPHRLLDNVHESLFFTKHISHSSFSLFGVTAAVLFLLGIATLIIAILEISQNMVQVSVAKAASSIILIAAAGPPIEGALSYITLTNKCKLLEKHAEELHGSASTVSASAVLKLLHSYDRARFTSPLLPEVIYKIRKNQLNRLWKSKVLDTN